MAQPPPSPPPPGPTGELPPPSSTLPPTASAPPPPTPAPAAFRVLAPPPRRSPLAGVARNLRGAGLACALLGVAAPVVAVVGFRQGWLDFHTADAVLVRGAAVTLALLAVLLGVVGLLLTLVAPPRRGLVTAVLAAAIGGATYFGLMQARTSNADHPPIHDVSTDWRDPPMPSAALAALRGPHADPVDRAPSVPEGPSAGGFLGRPVAEVNARTCPAAVPATLMLSPAAAYAKLKAAVVAEKLALVTDDPAAGRLEATARRGIWAIADDLIARVRPEGAGARVDLRSVSRAGLNDGGANCARITRLRAALGS